VIKELNEKKSANTCSIFGVAKGNRRNLEKIQLVLSLGPFKKYVLK
jgi:hypothetical protein